MILRNDTEQADIVEAGRRLGVILEEVAKEAEAGVSTLELDALAEQLIRADGDEPVFLGYTPEGAARPYPATLCVSVNDEVVHGIPNESPRILKEGDIVALDLGLTHKGLIVDSAITVAVGRIDFCAKALMDATSEALEAGIDAVRVGNRIGDISNAIEEAYKDTQFSIVKVLGGHGVGNQVHEEPFVPNFGHAGTGEEIVEGMVLALEPIANEGKAGVVIAGDGYTYRTKDGSRSAHFEHTVIAQKDGPLVITRRPSEQ